MLSVAQNASDPSGKFRGDTPPATLQEAFQKNDMEEISGDECRIRIQTFEVELQCMEDVDPALVREYKTLVKDIEDLEVEIERWGKEMADKTQAMEATRDRWLEALNSLIGEISERFSDFFQMLGFAGRFQIGNILSICCLYR